ncbi:condensation domain-containing protein [Saccharobesus litoralis]|uniref:condensation domain-containing protein n=1 Tax=Saccharobesus litoralis TaxID=2172099 RepID=UPI00131F359A|nr:condensation domain-containing protein [Saccharobesus litoralis]
MLTLATSQANRKSKKLPLSLAQQQIWLDQQLHPQSPHLTTGGLGFINGPLELSLFEQTVAKMVNENDGLRLLPLTDGTQILIEHWQEDLLEYHDFSQQEDSEQAIVQWWDNTYPSAIPLDGIHKPWHIYLIKSTPERYCIAMKYHHIMIDGFSTALAMNTMSVIYTELARAKLKITEEPLPLPAIYANGQTQYQQYITESQAYLQSKACAADEKYWLNLFKQLPEPLLEAKYQCNNKAQGSLPNAFNHYHHIAVQDYHFFQETAKNQKATTYHLFIVAICIYFSRIYNKQEVVIGVPVLNRSGKKYKSTLGMFVVIMPLKVYVEPDATTESLIEQVVATLRASYRHARYPASMLGQKLGMVASGKDRFFDITVSFEATNYSAHYLNAPTSEPRHTFGD